jgi:hypothetical protein
LGDLTWTGTLTEILLPKRLPPIKAATHMQEKIGGEGRGGEERREAAEGKW